MIHSHVTGMILLMGLSPFDNLAHHQAWVVLKDPLESDLSSGKCYPAFEQLWPGLQMPIVLNIEVQCRNAIILFTVNYW